MTSDSAKRPNPPASNEWQPVENQTIDSPVENDATTPSLNLARPKKAPWLHLLLLLMTIVTTMFWGHLHYAAFLANFSSELPQVSWMHGAWYSVTILAILGSHEFGHYFACRYYRVDASLPYFLPAPFLTGTFGAVIRIKQRIPTKPMLFDIGIAGPIAGFIIAVPALFVGLWLSQLTELPDADVAFITLGEPLLFQGAAWLIWGTPPDGYSINLHPMGFAAWFGLLATALNLFPIAQLDGGHITYAALGARSTKITVLGLFVVLGLTFLSPSWFLWAALLLAMVIFGGARHPRTLDDHIPLDRARLWWAAGAALIFVLCFTPAPVDIGVLINEP